MTRKEDQNVFDTLVLDAYRTLERAARFARQTNLSDIDIAKAEAAAGLCGVQFHKISIHGADADDYLRVEDDLEVIARKVSPLIEAIGIETRCNSLCPFDDSVFMDTFEKGFDEALGELHAARDRAFDRMEAAE